MMKAAAEPKAKIGWLRSVEAFYSLLLESIVVTTYCVGMYLGHTNRYDFLRPTVAATNYLYHYLLSPIPRRTTQNLHSIIF